MTADTRTAAGPWPRQRVARWALLLPVMMALLLAGDAASGLAPAKR
jgi:hypothetical protein